jgi:hypothetical protein
LSSLFLALANLSSRWALVLLDALAGESESGRLLGVLCSWGGLLGSCISILFEELFWESSYASWVGSSESTVPNDPRSFDGSSCGVALSFQGKTVFSW